ncbi:Uncharacterised protein [Salmonella enterica subsp. arizonae]|uniref:Uncharacterized protein n=1 Tax=Salmonella enterica subsp. arizonae TaxID=59203 RepID=A0A379T3Q3_SALER|nr:Uncharacterised protein [Salmonella enterica subsp. arizonae]
MMLNTTAGEPISKTLTAKRMMTAIMSMKMTTVCVTKAA